jgi:hypothetical protein
MKASGCLWNALTVLMLGLTVLACAWVGLVFANPQGPLNPLKPPMLGADGTAEPEALGTPTDVIEFPTLPPEWTATFTPSASPTSTPTPTRTDTPAPTETVDLTPVGPTATQSETPQPTRTPTRTPRPVVPTSTPASYLGPATPTSASGYP